MTQSLVVMTTEDDTVSCGYDSGEMGLKWVGADAYGHNVSLPTVVPGASVLRVTGSGIVAGTDQK